MKTSYGGYLQKEGCPRLNPSVVPWFVVKDAASLVLIDL